MSLDPTRFERRTFPVSSLSTAGAHACPPSFKAPQTHSPSNKLNLALGDVGRMGPHELRTLSTYSFVALYDLDATRAAPYDQKVPNMSPFKTIRELHYRYEKRIDAAKICALDRINICPVVGAQQLGEHTRCRVDRFSLMPGALLENRHTRKDISYGAPLSKVAFLENLAIRTGREIVWDWNACISAGVPKTDTMMHPVRLQPTGSLKFS